MSLQQCDAVGLIDVQGVIAAAPSNGTLPMT